MHETQTIDLGDHLTYVPEQHQLLQRLAQLAEARDRFGFSDDHVLSMLVDRYRERADRDEPHA